MNNPLLYVCFFFCLAPIASVAQTVDANYLNPKNHTAGAYKFLRFGESSQYWAGLMWNEGDANYGNGNDFAIFSYANRDITVRTGTGNFIVFPSSGGNMGIGTTTPDSKLHIYITSGSATYPTNTSKGDVVQSIRSNNNGIEIGNSRGYNDRKAWILARHGTVGSYGKYYSALHLQPDIGDKSQYRGLGIGYLASTSIPIGTHLAVNGKVGIGTLNPDSELTVKGNIHAEEVKVDLNVPAPDYVFKKEYKLKSLEEVQNYIVEYGHLPNIPSAQEIQANGIKLGEMDMKLLEKIEELTLYILQQEEKLKRIENLEMEISHLRKEIEKLAKE